MTGITLSSDVSNARTLVDNFILQDVLYRAGGDRDSTYYGSIQTYGGQGAVFLNETGTKILVGSTGDNIDYNNDGYAELRTLVPNTGSWAPTTFF